MLVPKTDSASSELAKSEFPISKLLVPTGTRVYEMLVPSGTSVHDIRVPKINWRVPKGVTASSRRKRFGTGQVPFSELAILILELANFVLPMPIQKPKNKEAVVIKRRLFT